MVPFEGKGDEKPGYLPTDIIFVIEEKKHPLFRRKDDDLEIVVEIPLVKALTGCSLSVPLRITFLVKFPSELSDQQRSEAVSILQDCSYD